jgi:arsenate reductase
VTASPPVVLFLCVHNAGRSQMAAALMDRRAQGRVDVLSAGTDPSDRLNPAVVAAMAEVGIDITARRPRALTDEDAQRADTIVTMGCGDSCPVYPGRRYLDWPLPDPAGRPIEEVRLIRDQIDGLVQGLVDELVS